MTNPVEIDKKVRELNDQTKALIAEGTLESRKRAVLLLKHQQILMRELLLEWQPHLEVEEGLQFELYLRRSNKVIQEFSESLRFMEDS